MDIQVAYFCAEFVLNGSVPTYAGGLGVLAGDIIREAYDQKTSMVAIGLFYHRGYTKELKGQAIDNVLITPEQLGLTPVVDKNGERIIISIPLQGSVIKAQAWLYKKNTVHVFLLDTNVEDNSIIDQSVTDHLYTADMTVRFKQEIVLGIGGYRLLKALNLNPMVYHLNDGHPALLSFELISEQLQKNIPLPQAIENTKTKIVFTNHTLVAAGQDVFVNDLVSTLLTEYASEQALNINDLIKVGLVRGTDLFSMTMLSLRVAGAINAVSKLHAQKAGEIWTNHPMSAVTNGIHLPTWKVSSDNLEQSHRENKKKLVKYINKNYNQSWSENDLIVSWARRIVKYKRPLMLFSDPRRISAIVNDEKRPVRILFSGNSHPSDKEGTQMVAQIKYFSQSYLKNHLLYLDGYNTEMAKILTGGSDVWVNTPVVGFEACGTSGMKAALNGALSLTTKDGWYSEVDVNKIGWEMHEASVQEEIYSLLEKEVVPNYYGPEGKTEVWIEKMNHSSKLIEEKFSATRMLQEYQQMLYLPTEKKFLNLSANPSIPQKSDLETAA